MLCRHQATRLHPPRAHIACSVLLSCQQLWKYIGAHTRYMELPCKSLQLFGLRVYNIGESCSCSSSLTYVPQCLSSSQIWSLLSDFPLSQMLTVITVQVWALSEFCGLICHFFFLKIWHLLSSQGYTLIVYGHVSTLAISSNQTDNVRPSRTI